MDVNDLNKMLAEQFATTKPNKEEQKFYLYYDTFGKILGMSANVIEDFKEEQHTLITREEFLDLQNQNINNYVVDTSKTPVTIVDISAEYSKKNIKVPSVDPSLWIENRLVTLQFVKDTRTLKIKVNNQLPAQRKIWVVPQGMYMRSLAEIILYAATDEDYHIPEYKNVKSCEILTEQDLNTFVAYREVENEKELSN